MVADTDRKENTMNGIAIGTMVSTSKEDEEMMIKGMSMSEFVAHCVRLGNIHAAIEEVIEYTKECIGNHLDNLDDRDLFTLLHDSFDDNLHTMDELDDVFEEYTVTKVLEELGNIEPWHDYFHAESKRSSNDLWSLVDFYMDKVVDDIFEDEVDYDDYEIDLIMEEHEDIVDRVRAAYKIYDKAKGLFNMALKKDPQELITVLWNMNQE